MRTTERANACRDTIRSCAFGLFLASAGAAACGQTGSTPDASGAGGAENGRAGEASGGVVSGGSASSGGRIGRAGNPPVSDAGAGAGVGGQASTECDASSLEGLDVFSPAWDPVGYPPYALDGCRLVYVAPDGIHRRNLADGTDLVMAGPELHPRRPSIAGGITVFEHDDQTTGSALTIWIEKAGGVSGFNESEIAGAAEPRAATNGVVFTKLLGPMPHDDMDVAVYDPETDKVVTIAEGPAQQRFADISETTVAYTDFSEDPNGYFDETASLADIVIVDRATGKKTVRAQAGKQAFPLLGASGGLAYLHWGEVHPEPKFSQFTLMVGRIDAPVSADFNVKGDSPIETNPAYNRPSLHGVHLDFVDLASGPAQLYRFALDQPNQPPAAVVMEAPTALYGPVASELTTLVASPNGAQSLRLMAFSR